jgi:hypothetical protein
MSVLLVEKAGEHGETLENTKFFLNLAFGQEGEKNDCQLFNNSMLFNIF